MRVAFIGLGVMGYPMAGHLAAHHEVTVYNRTAATAQRWCAQFPGTLAATPAMAARSAEVVLTCVGNDADVRDVLLGADGALAGLGAGATIVDHTTASAHLARELADVAGRAAIHFLDAPVSGGQAGAENAQLTIMVGGAAGVLERVRPVLDVYARSVTHIGASGAGQLAKMVNQICIAGVVQGLAEGIDFAQRAGLDVAAVIEAISRGAAQSWQMENRWQTMARGEFDFGFAVDWMRKDLGIAMDEAERNGAALELARLVDGYYAELQAMGGGRWDTSSLIARLGGNGEAES